MTRMRLPDRRSSLTGKVDVVLDGGQLRRVLVTVGFDPNTHRPMEVFCADWKAGTAMHSAVMDACILLSRLLQHGDSPEELAGTLCDHPPSIVGNIARFVASLERSEAA